MNTQDGPTWLSVVIPSFRGERWIDSALSSIAREPHEGVEVLLIDSGPSRVTRDQAACYTDKIRIRIFDRADLPSWQAKTNFGVAMAAAAHVCWLGVDDVWLPGRSESVRTWIRDSPHCALQLAPAAFIDGGGRPLGIWRCPLAPGRDSASALLIERLLVQNFIAAPAPIFRKDAWLACGGIDESLWYTADWDLWLKLASLGPVPYRDAVTVGFRLHPDSLTVTGSLDAADFRQQMDTVLARHLPRLAPAARPAIERVARVSIAVNSGLASASRGRYRALLAALFELACLGPVGVRRYWRDSRIVERLLPRLRAGRTAAA